MLPPVLMLEEAAGEAQLGPADQAVLAGERRATGNALTAASHQRGFYHGKENAICILHIQVQGDCKKKALTFCRWHEEKFKPIEKGDAIFTEDKYKSLHISI